MDALLTSDIWTMYFQIAWQYSIYNRVFISNLNSLLIPYSSIKSLYFHFDTSNHLSWNNFPCQLLRLYIKRFLEYSLFSFKYYIILSELTNIPFISFPLYFSITKPFLFHQTHSMALGSYGGGKEKDERVRVTEKGDRV